MQYARDSAMSALILGFFASCWFGRAQEKPPPGWRSPLIVGAVLSLIVAVIGAVYAWRNWSDGSALGESGAMRRYGIIVGVEFGIAAVGAAVIASCGGGEYIAAWVCLVVGVHFWPMAPVPANPVPGGTGSAGGCCRGRSRPHLPDYRRRHECHQPDRPLWKHDGVG